MVCVLCQEGGCDTKALESRMCHGYRSKAMCVDPNDSE